MKDEIESVMENSLESQAKWYVLHTYSGYEAMVKASLEQLIENNNLQNNIFDLKIPMEQTIEEKNGKKKVVERKLLPCYVFIKMIYSNQVWYLVTNTRGVTGFVGPQGRPLPLKEEEVRKMQLESVAVDADFAVGDNVSIDAGPLAGFVGKVKELNDSAQKAKVNVLMFGRNTDVEVEYVQIRKLNAVEAAEQTTQE
ncbi:MAG TPA: transcription termination/antitermination protein NusG [Candidatus Borkfalkia faecavium]|uniref:Transcription termination/antitermination protein NusG n=1 Tax=Candidatus Borkfalkia faecavium TaxID=2838508 RepID=A0A9D1W0N0_9FIRM|nr:transcription termination/antitermination protein NusG [Candidatus Borkfalkia faecavium]